MLVLHIELHFGNMMVSSPSLPLILFVMTGTTAQYTSTLSKALRKELFTTNDYDGLSRPDEIVNVTVQLFPIYLNELNIVSQDMSMAAFLFMRWTDSRLSWDTNPTYSSLDSIFSNSDYTWRPSLIIADAIENIRILDDDTNPIRITKSGILKWSPFGQYNVHCEIDVTFYPFDSQSCSILISTWGYAATEVNLDWDSPAIDMTFYKQNGEWNFKDYTTNHQTFSRGEHSFSTLTVYLNFKRRPSYQVMNTILPCMLLGFLFCFIFKLPVESGEKMGFTLTVLLAYAVYLSMVSVNMPTTSINTSLITVYLLNTMCIGILLTCLTVFVVRCYHIPAEQKVTKWIHYLCTGFIGKISGINRPDLQYSWCSSHKIHVVESGEKKEPCNMDKDVSLTWQEVSVIMDAALFRIALAIQIFFQGSFMLTLLIGWAAA